MVDIDRLCDWNDALRRIEDGKFDLLGKFVNKWGLATDAERKFVGDLLCGMQPLKKRKNAFNVKAFKASFEMAKRQQKMMIGTKYPISDDDINLMMAHWLNKAPGSIKTLRNRFGIK